MARSVDVHQKDQQARGFDMVTRAHESRANPSLAEGVVPTALAGGNVGAGSPGAVLGTGSNTDRYTPGIEAV